MVDCVFCRIIAGAESATVLQTWSDAIAIAPLGPVVDEHTLVIPRRHVADAAERPAVTGLVMAHAAEVAQQWPSANIITSIGAPAKQSVFHLHIHVVPRADGDGLMLPWGTTGDPHEPHWCDKAEQLYRQLQGATELGMAIVFDSDMPPGDALIVGKNQIRITEIGD